MALGLLQESGERPTACNPLSLVGLVEQSSCAEHSLQQRRERPRALRRRGEDGFAATEEHGLRRHVFGTGQERTDELGGAAQCRARRLGGRELGSAGEYELRRAVDYHQLQGIARLGPLGEG